MKRKDALELVLKRSAARHGFWTFADLVALGISRKNVAWLVAEKVLIRQRKGFYTTAQADPAVVVAARANGKVGCMSGARVHGLWVPLDSQHHVVVRPGRESVPKLPGVRVHRASSDATDVLCSIRECVEHVLRFHEAEIGLVVLESALNKGRIGFGEAQRMVEKQSAAKRLVLQHFNSGAQSGTETRVRLYLQRHGQNVGAQVLIPEVGIVDLLVNERIIIELDSKEFHLPAAQYHKDRARDLNSRVGGFHSIRLTWEMVWLEPMWEATKSSLAQIFGFTRLY